MSLPPWLHPLPQFWAQRPDWRVLDVSGTPHALLALHRAWAAQRDSAPQRLHYVCVLEHADALLQHAPAAWHAQLVGMLPGVQRLVLEDGALLLTLWLGECNALLRQQTMVADSVLLGQDTRTWLAPHALKPLLRHCQRASQLLAPPGADADLAHLAELLQRSGFCRTSPAATAHSTDSGLHAVFDPPWTLRKPPAAVTRPGRVLVLGAGLAGSAAAFSLAQRGWQVQVLGLEATPADGASGLPAGLFCPHTSPDDCPLSRLSRAGLQALLARLAQLPLQPGQDWQASGVLEHDGEQPSPLAWSAGPGLDWSRPASATQCQQAGLPADASALWHQRAGWLRPAALVQAQLQHPNIHFLGQSACRQLRCVDQRWQALDSAGQCLAQGDIAIVAAGSHSPQFLPEHWRLQPLRGQVTWATHRPAHVPALPPFPVNGSGNLVPHMPSAQAGDAMFWVMGSTFERDVTQLPVSAADQAAAHQHNLDKLAQLLPASAPILAPAFTPGDAACQPTWARVRLASPDRLPLAGAVAGQAGLFALTALGARGITLSVLCAELLAAQLHGEPLPLEAKLAQQLSTERLG